MKKLFLPIIGITLIVVGLIGWQLNTYSQANVPYPTPTQCVHEVANEISLMRQGWFENLDVMMDQEEACSEIVDEAFESTRTYRCWLDYLCETVLFSGIADLTVAGEDGFRVTEEHIRNLPSCVSPQDVVIPGTELKFLNKCHVENFRSDIPAAVGNNYLKCRELTGLEFSGMENEDSGDAKAVETFRNKSTAFQSLENSLKACSAGKKNSALQNKLLSLLNKMHGMEAHMEYLKEQLFRFDSMLPCYAAKCD